MNYAHIATMFRNIADQVDSLESIDFDSLSSTALGDALTRAERQEMADNPEEVAEYVRSLRRLADHYDQKAVT